MFRRVLVWSRYGYYVPPEMLLQNPSSRRVHRNKPASEYVSKNYSIDWPPRITFGSKGRRIICTFEWVGPYGSPNAGHLLYATLSVRAEKCSAVDEEKYSNERSSWGDAINTLQSNTKTK